MKIEVSKERIKELVEAQRIVHNNLSSCMDRGIQPDFEVEYNAMNGINLIAGAFTNFKYLDEPDKTWIIYPEFIDESGCIINHRDALIPSQGKAYVYIPNRDNIEKHKSIISLGSKGLMTLANIDLAEIVVTKVFF